MSAQAYRRAAKSLQVALRIVSSDRPQVTWRLRRFCSERDVRGPIISIDRSGLYRAPEHSQAAQPHKEPETQLAKLLKALIRFRGGPVSLAEYMSEALTNPAAGYYTCRDVFGRKGDFITSPEISQLFGEMVGVWCMVQWHQLGSPKKLHLVEMGPGRGTLMADLLRGMAPFQEFSSALNVHLVEVSPVLQKVQHQTLRCGGEVGELSSSSELTHSEVLWHRSLDDVPSDAPAIFVGNEFLDALPVHQFQKTKRGWCERLVDVAPAESQLHFQMVLSPGLTPASKLLVPRRLDTLPPEQRDSVQEIEISPQSIATAETLAARVESQGGAALLIDYGQDAPYPGSIQAIKDHRFIHFLSSPGDADLSCRVDFSAIKQGVEQSERRVVVHGVLPQGGFLTALGIKARLAALLESAAPDQRDGLIQGYNRITGDTYGGGQAAVVSDTVGPAVASERSVCEDMSTTYKVLAITGEGTGPPLPFPGSGVTINEA